MSPSDGSKESYLADRLQEYYARKFSSRSRINLSTPLRVGEGWENEVYSFDLQYQEAGEKRWEELILRIYPGDGGEEKSEREYEAMLFLSDAGYPVPRVKLRESDPSVLGKPFVVMERVAGPLMWDLFSTSSWKRKKQLVDLFCRMFVRLHRLDWRAFQIDRQSSEEQDPRAQVLDKISRVHDDFRSLDKVEFDPVFDWLRGHTPQIRFGDPSLIHWDYHPNNIIMKEDGTACVIDWTQAEILDYRFDLGWTLLLVSTHAHPWLAKSVLRRYERIAGARADNIEYFIVAACLKRLYAVSVCLTHGPERVGMRPGVQDSLKEHAAPLRRVYAILRRRTGIVIPEVQELLSAL